ncbi:MAG: NUDIX domain-containing protein [Ruminococcus sp.]|nr:NUDIX domain-containing protein [Ruminococcus sp.]
MERLLLMDERNYDPALPEIRRTAVRGIIRRGEGLLFIRSSRGELKLPGGGKEGNESDLDTLIREVREETGARVISGSVRPFGYIEEKRLSVKEPMIWHQFSMLYFCDVEDDLGETDYSESERSQGFRRVVCTVDEAIEQNRRMLESEGVKAWNRREYNTLLLIKKYFDDHICTKE